jgi:hypothetical protein
MYVLQRVPDGQYVAPPGQPASYTDRLEEARIYASHAEARHDQCVENEIIVSLDSLLRGGRRP